MLWCTYRQILGIPTSSPVQGLWLAWQGCRRLQVSMSQKPPRDLKGHCPLANTGDSVQGDSVQDSSSQKPPGAGALPTEHIGDSVQDSSSQKPPGDLRGLCPPANTSGTRSKSAFRKPPLGTLVLSQLFSPLMPCGAKMPSLIVLVVRICA